MESEIIPMCEDQGMAIVSWASLGGGMLTTADQRRRNAEDPKAPKFPYGDNEEDIQVSKVLEQLSNKKQVSFQAIVGQFVLRS